MNVKNHEVISHCIIGGRHNGFNLQSVLESKA
jgi:hypothetical protein